MSTIYHQNVEDIFDPQVLSNRVGKLEEQDVHLWGIRRNIFNGLKDYSKYLLSEDEQNRAQRFRFRKDHDLFVIGRYLTKVILAYYTDSTPERVNIIPDSFGKPSCGMDLFFNISHADDRLLLGFSTTEIGVDIEAIDTNVDIERIGERHFSEIEFQKMMTYAGDERAETFFEIWTQKESLVKGIGKGLSIPLKDFNVINPNGKVLWEFPNEKKYGDWYVQNIEVQQGFKSAFATQKEIVNLLLSQI
ncbi:MAG: 4'-phosphopantetheinyl transferase superfamily protein [Balneolaceae bacterium]